MTVVDETGSCGGVSYEDIRSSSREMLGALDQQCAGSEGSGVTDCSPWPGWCLIIMAANVFVCAERMGLAASCSLLALVAADWVLGERCWPRAAS